MKLKYLLPAVALSLLATNALAGEFKGNWTERFELKGGHYAVHTPKYVSLDGFITCGSGIDVDGMNLNGTTIKNLHLKTDSTRIEFVEALKRSNLYK